MNIPITANGSVGFAIPTRYGPKVVEMTADAFVKNLIVDYAPTSVATCKASGEKIAKGTLRLVARNPPPAHSSADPAKIVYAASATELRPFFAALWQCPEITITPADVAFVDSTKTTTTLSAAPQDVQDYMAACLGGRAPTGVPPMAPASAKKPRKRKTAADGAPAPKRAAPASSSSSSSASAAAAATSAATAPRPILTATDAIAIHRAIYDPAMPRTVTTVEFGEQKIVTKSRSPRDCKVYVEGVFVVRFLQQNIARSSKPAKRMQAGGQVTWIEYCESWSGGGGASIIECAVAGGPCTLSKVGKDTRVCPAADESDLDAMNPDRMAAPE